MAGSRAKLFLEGLCLSVLLLTFGCTLLNQVEDSQKMEPVKRLRIRINQDQREAFFEKLRGFADKHTYEFVLSDYGTTDDFLITIWADTLLITASPKPGSPETVTIFFSGIYPGSPINEEILSEFIIELKSIIGEIPNVTITEEE